MRRTAFVATLATASLVLAGCGGGNDLDGIDVSKGDAPKVAVAKDFTTEKTETRVISKGAGDEVKTGDTVKINYIAVNGRTGKEFDNSYETDTPMTLTLNEKTTLAGFQKGLVGQDIGSRVLVAVPAKDGAALLQSASTLGLKKDDTMVFLFDLVSKVPTEAAGKAQKPPATLPKLTYTKNKQPKKFVKTAKTEVPLTKSTSFALIKGKGKPVEAGQTITVQYLGQEYPAGAVVQESWSTGTPQPISLAKGAALPCWIDGLVGQTIGSRVLIACTSADAYGKDAKAQGKPEGPLMFAFDIVDAS